MHPTPAHSRWLIWLRKWRTPVFGMVLGLLLVLVIWVPVLQGELPSLWPWLVLVAVLDLLIPAIGGFLAASQTEDAFSGIGAGCLVSGISALIFAIPAIVLSVIAFTALPHPPCLAPCKPVDPRPDMSFFGLTAPIMFALVVDLCAVIGGTVSGWIGGMLGQRYPLRSHQSGTVAVPRTPARHGR